MCGGMAPEVNRKGAAVPSRSSDEAAVSEVMAQLAEAEAAEAEARADAARAKATTAARLRGSSEDVDAIPADDDGAAAGTTLTAGPARMPTSPHAAGGRGRGGRGSDWPPVSW